MPSWDEVQQYLAGAWMMLFGKADGLRRLDLSVDGFWNSFLAMPIALPPLLINWIAMTNERLAIGSYAGSRPAGVLASAIIEVVVWILPLIGLMFAARPAGISDRLIAYVVSTNWASAIIAWMVLPLALLSLFFPSSDVINLAMLVFFFAVWVMMWRLTNVAIGKGAVVTTAVFTAMVVSSIALALLLGSLFGFK